MQHFSWSWQCQSSEHRKEPSSQKTVYETAARETGTDLTGALQTVEGFYDSDCFKKSHSCFEASQFAAKKPLRMYANSV
ncbi:hypothetical protein AOLI_G00026490 [Acnodon oligacanthus]